MNCARDSHGVIHLPRVDLSERTKSFYFISLCDEWIAYDDKAHPSWERGERCEGPPTCMECIAMDCHQ